MARIAWREFRNATSGERIVASIYPPRRRGDGAWACRFVITGLPEKLQRDAAGVDSLQAVFEAMQGIRYFLAQSGLAITCWDGEVGEYGIYRPLAGFDHGMTKHLERVVAREVTKLVRKKMARARRRAR